MVHAQNLIDRLAVQEEAFLRDEFLAPRLPGGTVSVRIAGVICSMAIDAGDFTGWGVFRARSLRRAKLVRAASLRERQKYLALLPTVRMILSRRASRIWFALPAHQGDRRIRIGGETLVHLVDGGEQFAVVRARFDGRNFWFDGLESRHDTARAGFLREALGKLISPEDLSRSGLTAEERAAYAVNYFRCQEVQEQFRRDEVEIRLRASLAHAGAEFMSYAEHRDGYRVRYRVGRRRYVSSVRKDDLTVQVAGICLSGQDEKFDLSSLVGVFREAGGDVLRIGNDNRGLDENDYRRIHPPE